MLLATAALDARVARRVVVAAIAAALQGVFCWLILREAVEPIALPAPRPLEVTILQTVSRVRPAKQPRKHRRRTARQQAAPRAPGAQPPPRADLTNAVTLPRPAKPAQHAPVDWQRAMQGEVRAEESRSRARQLRFGFPRQSASAPATPRFGWDYASTHRLEALPQGGMLINLNDHCALVFYGLMLFPGCRIGRIPANGHLFDHMRDRRSGSGGLP